VLAISKADLLDEELRKEVEKELPPKHSNSIYIIHNSRKFRET